MGFFDAIGSIAKAVAPAVISAVFPPAGLAMAASNLFTSSMGNSMLDIIGNLGQQMGAPKFLVDIAKDAVKQAMQQFTQPCGSDVTDHVRDKVGDRIKDFGDSLFADFMDCFKEYKKDHEKKCGNGKGPKAGDSFLVVLAKILGEIENKQFDKVTKAAQEVSDLLGAGGDKKQSEQTGTQRQAEFDKMEALKGESQTMTALANSVSTTLDGLFKAASTASQRVGA
jgi:hypothetical protein